MVREALVGLLALGLDMAWFAAVPAESLLLAMDFVVNVAESMIGGLLETFRRPCLGRELLHPLADFAKAELEVLVLLDVQFVDLGQGETHVFLLLLAGLGFKRKVRTPRLGLAIDVLEHLVVDVIDPGIGSGGLA